MVNRTFDGKNIILNLIYFLMVFSLVYVVGIVINLHISFPVQIFFVFITTMIVKFIIDHIIILYLSIIVSFFGGLLIDSYLTPIYPFFERFMGLINNIYEHLFMNELIVDENILPFWILMTIIYSVFTSIILFKPKEKLFSLLIIYLPLFIYYWYIYINQAYFALAIFLFTYFVLYGMLNFYKERKQIDVDTKKQFGKLSPFWNRTSLIYGILIVIIALLLPKSESNLRWYWMEDQIASIIPKIESMRSTNENVRGVGQANRFNYASTGFQESPSQLGGPISPNHRLIMNLRADGPTYLRGTVRHHYDGRAWETISTDISSHLLESNFGNISYDDREKFYEEKDVIVQFVDYSSTTLFSPFMPIVANADRGDQISLTKDYIMELPQGVYDGESYGIKYLEAKPYGELLHLRIDNSYHDLDNIENYLQVPSERITERTINLKNEITSGIDDDLEKAIAIESYLRENYDYKLDTSPIPEDHEFIDYFLFEEESGYCTYYATAMAIFLRLEGIPSRYVEGYIAQETDDGEIYNVRQSHAHAWVEAFIEPVGWMTFEPTSAYQVDERELEYVPGEEDIDNEDIVEDDDTTSPLETQLEHEILADENIGIFDESQLTGIEDKEPLFTGKTILSVFGIILLIFPIRFLIKLIRYKINQYKINKLSNYDKMLVIYNEILKLTEKLGSQKKEGETHYEYSNRIGYKFKGLKELTNIFVRTKYGNLSPSDEEVEKFIDLRKELDEKLKVFLGRVKYYIEKY